MGKGQTVKNAKSKSPTGTSEGYIFGEEKEQKSVSYLGDLEVFTELRRTDLASAYEELFRDSIGKRNEAKASELAEIRMKKEERKAKRKEAKATGEDMKLWDKMNPQIKMQSLERYAPIAQTPLEYFSEKDNLNQNLCLDLIPIIGEMSDYNVYDKYGEPTGLTKSQALENRKICTEILKNVAERWNDDFPQLPLIMASVHNDSWSTHGHFKCVPVAHYEPSSNLGVDKAPGLYRALEQMGIEPDKMKVAVKEEALEKPLSEKQFETMRIEAMYERMDTIIVEEMERFGWKKEVKHATEKDLDKYIELADLQHQHEVYTDKIVTVSDEVDYKNDELKLITRQVKVKNETVEHLGKKINIQKDALSDLPKIIKSSVIVKPKEKTFSQKAMIKDDEIVGSQALRDVNKIAKNAHDYHKENIILKAENKQLENSNDFLSRLNETYLEENKEVTSLKQQLKQSEIEKNSLRLELTLAHFTINEKDDEITMLKEENKSLKQQLSDVYTDLKERVKENKWINELVDRIPFFKKKKGLEENQTTVEDTLKLEVCYQLSDLGMSFYNPSSWHAELKNQRKINSLEEIAYFDNYESFYNKHEKSIESAIDYYDERTKKELRTTFDRDNYIEEASLAAYQITAFKMRLALDKKEFDIPDHPNRDFKKEDYINKPMVQSYGHELG